MNVESVLFDALLTVIPSKQEKNKMEKIKEKVMRLIDDQVKKIPNPLANGWGYNHEIKTPILVGSFSKGTWLSGEADLDIFIPFKPFDGYYGVPEEAMKRIGLHVGFDSLKEYKPYTRYAEHPFAEAVVDGVKVNVVPCFDVPLDKLKSTVDRTPHHTRFMNEHLTLKQKNDVRLLKKFMKVGGVYGAEIAKQGFSGYVCESLVHYFGSFVDILVHFSEVKPYSIIGTTTEKMTQPINIVDPLDPKRNLGTAISVQKLSRFIHLSRLFLKTPSLDFFTELKKPALPETVVNSSIVVQFKYDEKQSPDNIYGEAKHVAHLFELYLKDFGVIVSKTILKDGKVKIAFLLESLTTSLYTVRHGPTVFKKEYSEPFIEKNKDDLIYVGDFGDLKVLERRKYVTAHHALHDNKKTLDLYEHFDKEMSVYTLTPSEALDFFSETFLLYDV